MARVLTHFLIAFVMLFAVAANAAVTVTISPTSGSLCEGNSQTFNATYSTSGCEGTPGTPAYQWYVDNVAVSGQTASSFTTSFASGNHTVKCSVTVSPCGSGTSSDATMTITAAGVTVNSATASPSPAKTCDTVKLTASASPNCGSSSITYSWDFGDGSAPTPYDPSPIAYHQYAAGTWTATVTAKDGQGHTGSKSVSPAIVITTPATPGQVTNLQATAVSATEIDLTWTAAANATVYNVYRATGGGSSTLIGHTQGTSYPDTTCSATTSYTYTVSASACVDSTGNGTGPTGQPSSPVTATTPCSNTITLTISSGKNPAWAGDQVTYTANVAETCATNPVTNWTFSGGLQDGPHTGTSVYNTWNQGGVFTVSATTVDTLSSASASLTQTVYDYQMASNPLSVTQGTTVSGVVTATGQGGYSGPVTISAGSVPSGLHIALIDPSLVDPCPDILGGGTSVTLPLNATVTVQVCADPTATPGTYNVTFTGSGVGGAPARQATMAVTVNQYVASAGPVKKNAYMASTGALVNPGSLLDEVGGFLHPVADDKAAAWLAELHRLSAPVTIADKQNQANLHLWMGEYRLAHDEQPDDAIWHFRQIQKIGKPNDPIYGRAAYDTAIALYYARAYQDSADTFRTLLDARTMLPGYDRRTCALWYRIAGVRAAYHAQRAAMGIPEPKRLDSYCAASSLAIAMRSLGLPFDRDTILKVCRVTGEGSNLQDVIDAGRHLGVIVRPVTADDRGLMAMPKPLIAHVEHDHFLAVLGTDKTGVTTMCSHMGGWPGGSMHLTWDQWHAMEADVYATVTAPNSVWDRALTVALTPGAPKGLLVASSHPLTGLTNSDTRRVLAAAHLMGRNVILYSGPTPPVACGSKPGTLRGVRKKKTDGDPVDLATGEEQYSPKPDLVVYNPNGPAVVWQRSYASFRGPGPAYEPNDFGVGWSHPYNIGVYDPSYNNPNNDPNYQPLQGQKYVFMSDGTQVAFNAPAFPTVRGPVVICTPVLKGVGMQLEWHYTASSKAGYYVVVQKDRMKWTTGLVTAGVGSYPISQITDAVGNGLVFGYSTPMNKLGTGGNAASISLCDWPVLNQITDLKTSTTLLSIQRNPNRTIASVTDCYGRKVAYHVGVYNNALVPCGFPQSSLELDQVSYVVPQAQTQPANYLTYEYQNYTNLDGNETTPYLHKINRPSPNGAGTSSLTINYDPNMATVTSVVDANGNSRNYAQGVDAAHTVVTVKDAGQNTVYSYTVGFDASFNQTTETDGAGNTIVTYAYADVNNPTSPSKVTDGNGRFWTYSYDTNGSGNLLYSLSPRGLKTTYTWAYDASSYPLGELRTIQESNGATTKPAVSFTYFEPSGLLQTATHANPDVSNSNNVVSTYQYTALGNVSSISTTPVNASATTSTTTFNYTSDAGDSAHSVPSASQTEKLGQPLTVTDNLGHTTHARYDSIGNAITIYDAIGRKTDYNYVDAANGNINISQLQSVTNPASGETGSGRSYTQYIYGFEGGPALSVKSYNESGTLVQQSNSTIGPEGELLGVSGGTWPVTYSYDAMYRRTSVTDGLSHATHYYYNKAGYADAVTYPGYAGPTPAYNATTGRWDNITGADSVRNTQYDLSGALLKTIDGRGVETDYTYGDPDGALTNIHFPASQLPDRNYTYEATFGRLLTASDGTSSRSYAYDGLDNLTSETTSYTNGPQNKTIGYLYFSDGSLRQMTTPAGSFSYGYDGGGRLSSLSNPFMETTNWSYLDNNWPQSRTMANGVSATVTLDAMGSVTNLVNARSNSTIVSQFNTFQYDGLGNQTNMTSSSPSGGPNGQQYYMYDQGSSGATGALGQVTSEYGSAGAGSYTYDAAGNPSMGTGYSYNADNQVSGPYGSWAYDGNGNPTAYAYTQLTWDAENNLTGSTGAFSAGYMDDGRRAWKAGSNSVKTYFLYSGSTPVCEMDIFGNVTATNTFADGLISRHLPTATTFYAFDPQGNVAQRLNAAATVTSSESFTSYGKRPSGAGTQVDPFGYKGSAGYYTDTETGYIYLTHRYYDPAYGRFLNRDPIGYAGGLNVYAYCANGPTSGSDPSGLTDEEDQILGGADTSSGLGFYKTEMAQSYCAPGGVGAGFQAGSQERKDFSEFWHQVPGVGTVMGGLEAATGCDYVAGTQVSTGQRIWGGAQALMAAAPLAGALRKPATQLHHLLPTEFRQEFARLGLDHDDWVVSVAKKVHQEFIHGFPMDGRGGWWNQQWREFFEAHANAGTAPGLWDVMNKMRSMQEFWGIQNKTIFRYPEKLIRLRDRIR